LWIDDEAGGHNGTNTNEFLKTLGVKRCRVLGLCTSVIQPADRPQTNGKLKLIVERIMLLAVLLVDRVCESGGF
jgi:hypothetical protein